MTGSWLVVAAYRTSGLLRGTGSGMVRSRGEFVKTGYPSTQEQAICLIASFDSNYQNPSLLLFVMLIRAIVTKPHWEFKAKEVSLVLVVK